MQMRHLIRTTAALLAGLCFLPCPSMGTPVAAAAEGLTPYPADGKTMPGKGPIRIFNWMQPTREHYFKNREKDQGAVVFTGDSLTQGWKNLAQSFPGLKVANRGIGGDTSRGILFRFQEDVLALQPAAVVILAGINDLTARAKAEEPLSNIRDMVKAVRAYKADAPVILCEVPATSQKDAPVDDAVRKAINEGLAKIASEDPRVAVCPLAGALLTPQGEQDLDCYAKDRLHLGAKGYERWSEALKPVMRKLGILQN